MECDGSVAIQLLKESFGCSYGKTISPVCRQSETDLPHFSKVSFQWWVSPVMQSSGCQMHLNTTEWGAIVSKLFGCATQQPRFHRWWSWKLIRERWKGWVRVLICWRAGMVCRGICAGWIDGLRLIVWGSTWPSVRSVLGQSGWKPAHQKSTPGSTVAEH